MDIKPGQRIRFIGDLKLSWSPPQRPKLTRGQIYTARAHWAPVSTHICIEESDHNYAWPMDCFERAINITYEDVTCELP